MLKIKLMLALKINSNLLIIKVIANNLINLKIKKHFKKTDINDKLIKNLLIRIEINFNQKIKN